MTSTHVLRSANGIPSPDISIVDMTIEQIMDARNVGKKAAYAAKRKATAKAHDEPVPTNQRERVLSALYRHQHDIRTSKDLMTFLQREDYAIDGHDAVKVLWSLQKTGHVKFRERQGPKYLYGIRLTAFGIEAAKDIVLGQVRAVEFAPESDELIAEATELTHEALAIVDERLDTPDETAYAIERGAMPSIFHLDDGANPTIRGVRDRARKAKRLAEAAKILEEAGEDELALTIMTKTEFTMLELEIIDVLERMEEN